jgi:hypothetical protein
LGLGGFSFFHLPNPKTALLVILSNLSHTEPNKIAGNSDNQSQKAEWNP